MFNSNYLQNHYGLRIVIVCLSLFLESCSNNFELPNNASEILTNGTSKTWKLSMRLNDGHRMNMGDCFLSYRVTYNSDRTITDNNSMHKDCGESMDAKWSFYTNEDGSFIKLKGDKVSKLLNQKRDYKYFRIKELSDSLLIVTFKHKQFGNVMRTIEDHLVPENIFIKDRDFHN